MQQSQHSSFTAFKLIKQESLEPRKHQSHIKEQNLPDQGEIQLTKRMNGKNQQIEGEMKKIGFRLDPKGMDKSIFAKDLSKILGNFFNPLINTIALKERKVCQKLGYIIEQPEDFKDSKSSENIVEESKIQSPLIQSKVKTETTKKNFCQNQERVYNQNSKTQKSQERQVQFSSQKKSLKRRIIRKLVKKPQIPQIKRNHDQKTLVKEMEKKFGVKLKNNRLYMKGMPKKPVSSFFFFFKEYSPKIHEESQQVQPTKQLSYGSALAKRISLKWKEMSEEQKQPYYAKSMAARAAYKQNMDAFKNQNKAVFDSFRKIKRVKANETRRIKIQKDSMSLSRDSIEQEAEVQENSESAQVQKPKTKNSNEKSLEPIDLENGELQIVIPDEGNDKSSKRPNRNRNLRQRYKSVHKPKSPAPSFFFFYNQKKAQISKQHGVNRGARITQIASVMWKELSDEQKQPYEILADERRKRYYEEMKQFELQHPEQWAKMQEYKRRVATNNLHGKRKKPVAVVQQSEEESSKSQSNSESIQQEIIEVDSLEGEIIKKTPSKTKKETKIIEEKHQLSETALKREEFKPNCSKKRKPQSNIKVQDKQDKATQKSDYKEHRPKAPISSFFMFYKMNNSMLADQFKESNGGQLVKYASEIWKNMTETEKKPYEIQSQKSRENYYKEMEAYKEKYPEEIKQRKLDLKKRQELIQEGHIPKKKRRPTSIKNPSNIKQEQNLIKDDGIKIENAQK